MTNYDELIEQIFKSIDVITTKKIQELKFDKTILCMIEDDSERENGKYRVTDGSSVYYAYSDKTNYRNKQKVYVVVPSGDYSQQLTIISKYNESLERKIVTKNFIDVEKVYNISEEFSLKSGSQDLKYIELYNDEVSMNLEPYSIIEFSAFFNSKIGRLANKGDYGLLFTITHDGGLVNIYSLTTSDMSGNVYNLNLYSKQKILFEIKDIKNVENIQVIFYQGKNAEIGEDFEKESRIDDIFVKNINILVGFRMEDLSKTSILLFSDKAKYDGQDKINLKSIIAYNDNNKITFAASNKQNQLSKIPISQIRFYRKNSQLEKIDKYLGDFWELIYKGNTFDFQDLLAGNSALQSENLIYKVVYVLQENGEENFYCSNELCIKNELYNKSQEILKEHQQINKENSNLVGYDLSEARIESTLDFSEIENLEQITIDDLKRIRVVSQLVGQKPIYIENNN